MIPIGRLDGKASLLYADGHVDARYPGALTDMRMWIDAADEPNFMWR